MIDYNHEGNLHTVLGARRALELIFEGWRFGSLLDVGCGTGTWIRGALDLGVPEVYGVDGVDIPGHKLLFPSDRFLQQDLSLSWDLGKRFDVAICLEVAEHLPAESAPVLIECLAKHSDLIMFSAAVPGQLGQHHINCQWPSYWQSIFNRNGFCCADWPRWKLWDCADVEPWYRQNLFIARREPNAAGVEPRIQSVIHPEVLSRRGLEVFIQERAAVVSEIEAGLRPASWYLRLPLQAAVRKLGRRVRGGWR